MNIIGPSKAPQSPMPFVQKMIESKDTKAANIGGNLGAVASLMQKSIEYDKMQTDRLARIDKSLDSMVKSQKKMIDSMKGIAKGGDGNKTASTRDIFKKKEDGSLKELTDIHQVLVDIRTALDPKKKDGGLGGLFAMMIPLLAGLAGKFIPALVSMGKMIGSALTSIPKMFKQIASAIKGFGKFGSKAVQVSKSVGGAVVKGAKGAVELAKGGGKGVLELAKGAGKLVGGGAKGAMGAAKGLAGVAGKGVGKMLAKGGLKRIPILGTVMALGFAFAKFTKGDIVGGLMELGSGGLALLDLVAPGVGTALSLAMDAAIIFRDMKKDKKDKGNVEGGKALAGVNAGGGDKTKGDAYSAKTGSAKIPVKFKTLGGLLGGIGGGVAKKSAEVATEAVNMAKSGAEKLGQGAMKMLMGGGNGYYKNARDVDISGINPQMWANFVNMASEYSMLTNGKSIGINSAYRSIEEQQKLWDKYGRNPKRVARPGKSMHNWGYAMDIQSTAGNELDRLGLLKKYGFDRPLSNEPWHMEPAGLKAHYAEVRSGEYNSTEPKEVGDIGETKMSVPEPFKVNGGKASVGKKFNGTSTSGPTLVKLMPEDIAAIANAMGTATKEAMPKQQQASSIGGKNANPRR